MKLPSKVSQWFQSIPTFKFLFLLALFLLANAFVNQQYLIYKESSQQDSQKTELINFIITSGRQQLATLIKNNKLEPIDEILEQQLEYDLLHKIAIYNLDGTLINNVTKPENNSLALVSKVKHLVEDEQNLGYLVFEFYQGQNIGVSNYIWLYYFSAVFWLLSFLLLLTMRKNKPTKIISVEKSENSLSYKKELLQLLKRSQQESKSESKNLLIIHSNWESHPKNSRQPILSLLNRWTRHNQSHLVSFDKNLLVLSLSEKLDAETFKKIQLLEACFMQIGINPTLLIHQLEFNSAIYQHFFGVVERGVWLESNHQLKVAIEDSIGIQEDIEFEVESYGLMHLCKLQPLKAEDATAIERQSRFYLT